MRAVWNVSPVVFAMSLLWPAVSLAEGASSAAALGAPSPPAAQDVASRGGPDTSKDVEGLGGPWWQNPTEPTAMQYGVGLATEIVTSPGAMCNVAAPCLLGSGAGVQARLGFLYGRTLYAGVAYALTKQDPQRVYRFATLQQLRIEARRYINTGQLVRGFVGLGGGIAGYGDEWQVDTFGPLGFLSIGSEIELSHRTLLTASISYRVVRFNSFTDSGRTDRAGGFAQFIALDFVFEARDPVGRDAHAAAVTP